MIGWVDGCLRRALSVSNEKELAFFIQTSVTNAGFSNWSYLARVRIPVTQPRNVFFASSQEVWSGGVELNALWAKHPIFSRVANARAPLVWADGSGGAIHDELERFGLHGLRSGWAQCCWDASGARGAFAVSRPEGALSEAELVQSNAGLAWLAQVVHVGMMTIDARQRPAFEIEDPLTEREVEILRWTAEGKTASEVADILSIAERTVNFHITRSVEKLKVNNKLAATVRAAMLGML